MKKAIITITLIILVVNLPLFDFFFQENFSYTNIDNSFTYVEEAGKGGSYQGCQKQYGYFLCQHPEKDLGDNRLFRTFTIKPWRVWEWRQLLLHSERFMLPYKQRKGD